MADNNSLSTTLTGFFSLATLCAGLFCGLVENALALEAWHQLPEEWSILSPERIESTDCPKAEGLYRTQGRLIENRGKAESVSGYIADWHPRGEDSAVRHFQNRQQFPLVSKESFLLRQHQEGFSVVRWANAREVQVIDFNKHRGDYWCQDGWILLAPIHRRGASEGGAYDVTSEVSIARLSNGGILYRQVLRSSRRDLLLFSKSSEAVSFFFFPKLGDQ